MLDQINRQDLKDLRDRLNKLEEQTAGMVVKIGVLASLISITIPAVASVLPHFLS